MDDRGNVVEAVFAGRRSLEEADVYQAMTYGRIGTRPQMCLLLWKASGEVRGFAYADWTGIQSRNIDEGFTMVFGRATVRIGGRNLSELFRYVCNFRAAEVIEIDNRAAMLIAADKPVVWEILIEPNNLRG